MNFGKTLLISVFICVSSANVFANERSLDEKIDDFVAPAADMITSIIFYSFSFKRVDLPLILVWLFTGGLFFTFFMKFINIRGFRTALDLVRGVYDDPKDKGEVTHFQALATAVSGTVGLGNIAGVAVAIGMGGPGATFWMILAGLLGMTSKFVECTLGVKYRIENSDGTVSGGPMYYLSRGLKKKGMGTIGSVLAVLFAVLCVGGSLGGGNMFQGNQATSQIINMVGGDGFFSNRWVIGVVMALFVGSAIIGGIKSIARWTEKLVPFMCAVYLLASFAIIFKNYSLIPDVFMKIIQGAFMPDALYGGITGVMIMGIRRAFFSNEAGMGSASIAHSAVKTNEPVTEGLVSLLEPFIDTVLICTLTAMVIIITGSYTATGLNGIEITSAAFQSFAWWFPYILSGVVVMFAFSTMISWSYYGLKAWTFLLGNSRFSENSFKIIFCIMVVIGASMNLESVIGFSDAMMFAMSFPNMIGMYLLAPEIRKDLDSFMTRVKSGEIKKIKK